MTTKKVFVGMSGGVDSTVTAALLQDQGYEVTGVFMKNWAADMPGFECPWRKDLLDAKRATVKLGIPLKIYDFCAEYKQYVVDYMLDEYKNGFVPNPDMMCNQYVKFDLFLRAALDDGADMIATGHYARIIGAQLHAGVDEGKDQSYFLYRMPKHSLERTLMPLGDMHKDDVRRIARDRGFANAGKKDSVGVCFVGDIDINDFLRSNLGDNPGDIVDESGGVIGKHQGLYYYSIGQRQGIDALGQGPYYVIDKDVSGNKLVVSNDISREELWTDEFTLTNIRELGGLDDSLTVRFRHLGELHEVKTVDIDPDSDAAKLETLEPIKAISPGQSAVLYSGDKVVAGGIITSTANRSVGAEHELTASR